MNKAYAEESVIGSLIVTDGSAMDELPTSLDCSMFRDEICASAFGIYQAAYENEEGVSAGVIVQKLHTRTGIPVDIIDKKIRELIGNASLSTIAADGNEIIRSHKAKQLSDTLNRIEVNSDNLGETLDYLTMVVDGLSDRKNKRTKTLAEITKENKDNYFKESEKPKIEMEFAALNDLVGGFEGGDMIVIGARPAVGKSAFAAQMTNHFSELGKKIGYFNLEMPENQIYERFVSAVSGIGLTRIKRAVNFTGDEKPRFDKANEILETKDQIVVTTGSQTVNSIKALCKNAEYDVIIVDYLQLIKPEGRYRGNRFAEVGEISHSLKAIATDLQIPVIVLSQLNRASVGREDKEPTMSELRESGDIEQDASVIILLWNLDDEGKKKGCKIEKNRQGKIGTVKMEFNGDLMKFVELTDIHGFEPMDDTPFSSI